jgi:hypothetical protein
VNARLPLLTFLAPALSLVAQAAEPGPRETGSWREQRVIEGRRQWVQARSWRDEAGGAAFTVYYGESGAALPAGLQRRFAQDPPAAGIAGAGVPGERAHPGLAQRGPRVDRPAALRRRVPAAAARSLDLGGLNPEERNLYDQARAEPTAGKASVLGLVRDLPAPLIFLGPGQNVSWQPVGDGGWVARLTLSSPGAEILRVQWRGRSLPPGTVLSVLNADGTSAGDSLGPVEEAWAPSLLADAALLEAYLPPGASPADGASRLSVAQVVHGLESPKSSPATSIEGTCHDSVTCADSAWQTAGDGVAYMTFLNGSILTRCSGTLLNDNDPDTQVPYFLTANHCINTQTKASTAEFYWFFQADTCNTTTSGTVTTSGMIKTSNGGTLLATGAASTASGSAKYNQSSTDFTLLQLATAPPAGVYYNGWSTAAVASGQSVTAIHHPQGTYQRISTGAKTATNYTYYWPVQWSSGTTVQGSSGGPLLNASHQVIGQLFDGAASCGNLLGVDNFGRLDQTYPFIASYIDMPEITAQPQPAEALAGQTATFSVTAAGTNLTYQWYSGTPGGGNPIGGATAASYTTPALASSASYYVEVINTVPTPDLVVTSGAAVVTVFANAYYQWAAHSGIPDIPPNVDSDRDNLPNELEYILDFDPLEPSSAVLPFAQFQSGTGLPMITFALRPGLPAGTVVTVETSVNLTEWGPANVVIDGNTVVATAGAATDTQRYFKITGDLPF